MSLEINGVVFADRHPLFFYEFALNLLGVLIMHLMYKKKRYSGQIVSFYLAWYGIIRSLLELLRDSDYQLGFELFGIPVLFSQLITIIMAVVGVAAFVLGFVFKNKFKFLQLYSPLAAEGVEESAFESEEAPEEEVAEEIAEESLPEEEKTKQEENTVSEKEINDDTQNS
jgi:phosphatidylglycerol:prolipoprotein diacylglycerol transferase